MTTIETLPTLPSPVRPKTMLERSLDLAPTCDIATRGHFFGAVFKLDWTPGDTRHFDNAAAFQQQVDDPMIDYLSQVDGATTAWMNHAPRVTDLIIPKATYSGREKTIPGALLDIRVTRLNDPYRQFLVDISAGNAIYGTSGKKAGHLKPKPDRMPEQVRKQWIGFDLKAILNMPTDGTSTLLQTRVFYAPLKFQSATGLVALEKANHPAQARRFFTEATYEDDSGITAHIAKWGSHASDHLRVTTASRSLRGKKSTLGDAFRNHDN